MNPREAELVARELLEHPAFVDVYFKEKRWAGLAALVRFARREVPIELAPTDPALYRRLREQITRFFLLGGDVFSLEALEAKARGQVLMSPRPGHAPRRPGTSPAQSKSGGGLSAGSSRNIGTQQAVAVPDVAFRPPDTRPGATDANA